MEKLTITEALSEINLIGKKIEKKSEAIMPALARMDHVPDPYPEGAAAYIEAELQSIKDHEDRLVRIRSSIARANLDNEIDVEGEKRPIFSWLQWRREVYEKRVSHYKNLLNQVNTHISNQNRNYQVFKDERTQETKLSKLILNINVKMVNSELERLLIINEKLDGLLSLKNATIVIEF